jgi:hypothetical protein
MVTCRRVVSSCRLVVVSHHLALDNHHQHECMDSLLALHRAASRLCECVSRSCASPRPLMIVPSMVMIVHRSQDRAQDQAPAYDALSED